MELTQKQLKLLKLISEGKTNKEIAQILNLDYQTVRNNVHYLRRKLKMNRVQMAIWYKENESKR